MWEVVIVMGSAAQGSKKEHKSANSWKLLEEQVTELIPERQREPGRIGERKRIPVV